MGQHAKTNSGGGIRGLGAKHHVNSMTSRSGLVRRQDLPEHLCSNLRNFRWGCPNMNAAFESVLETSLAAAARVNLRFDHKIDIAELTGDLLRFVECRCDFASRCRHIEFLQ